MLFSQQDTALLDRLYDVLLGFPGGIKEYDLMKMLHERGFDIFRMEELDDPLVLFQSHFVLFHLLYSLRDHLHHQQKATLEIHCLEIKLGPLRSHVGEELPVKHDPLGEYYLDLNNLTSVERQDAQKMIDDFWKLYDKFHSRDDALGILGLMASATQSEIKQRYRKLSLEHHPDHGGDPEVFQNITSAAQQLLS